MTFPDSVRVWQSTWFYCTDIPCAGSLTGLPPYTSERVRVPPSLTVDKGEKTDVEILVTAVVSLIQGGVTGLDLLEVFLSRRIQQL
jgi:hypothetical protein